MAHIEGFSGATPQRLAKADLRRETSAWKALVWAYRDECMASASNMAREDHLHGRAGFASARADAVRVDYGGGTVKGLLEAHDDAVLIDRLLWQWFGADWRGVQAVARAAEAAVPLAPDGGLSPLKASPCFRANGNIEMLYPLSGRKEPYLCPLQWSGATAQEFATAARRFDLFLGFLDVMPGFELTRWKITSAGVDSRGRIIDNACYGVARGPEA